MCIFVVFPNKNTAKQYRIDRRNKVNGKSTRGTEKKKESKKKINNQGRNICVDDKSRVRRFSAHKFLCTRNRAYTSPRIVPREHERGCIFPPSLKRTINLLVQGRMERE